MITLAQLKPAGKFLKPHGINGEIAVLRNNDDIDFAQYNCIVVDVDGIFVPFFLTAVRPKGSETDLVTIDGVSDEQEAASFTNKTLYVLRDESEESNPDDANGFYAEDLLGFTVKQPDGRVLGNIARIDDTTANWLFVIETPEQDELLIPVADQFIAGIDPVEKVLTVEIPPELLTL